MPVVLPNNIKGQIEMQNAVSRATRYSSKKSSSKPKKSLEKIFKQRYGPEKERGSLGPYLNQDDVVVQYKTNAQRKMRPDFNLNISDIKNKRSTEEMEY